MEGASKSKTKEIDVRRLTVLPDAASVTSSCVVTVPLQVLATKGKLPKSNSTSNSDPNTKDSASGYVSVRVSPEEPTTSTVPDDTVLVSAVPDASTLGAALQDVSCPASIIEI